MTTAYTVSRIISGRPEMCFDPECLCRARWHVFDPARRRVLHSCDTHVVEFNPTWFAQPEEGAPPPTG